LAEKEKALQQTNQGGDDPKGDIVDSEFLEAGEQPLAFLGPTHHPLDVVPLAGPSS
jgi:hypothetical protein